MVKLSKLCLKTGTLIRFRGLCQKENRLVISLNGRIRLVTHLHVADAVFHEACHSEQEEFSNEANTASGLGRQLIIDRENALQ